MEMGPKRSRDERGPSREEVARWAKASVADLVSLAEAFAVTASDNPASLFIQPQMIQIMAVLDALMAVVSDLDVDWPGHRAIQDYLLDYFGRTFPKEL